MRVQNGSILAVLPLLAVIGASCGGSSDADLVEAAFLEFQTGLAEAKGDVLSIVDDSTRTYFEELAKSIRETCRLVSEAYPSDDRAATLRSVGETSWRRHGMENPCLFICLTREGWFHRRIQIPRRSWRSS